MVFGCILQAAACSGMAIAPQPPPPPAHSSSSSPPPKPRRSNSSSNTKAKRISSAEKHRKGKGKAKTAGRVLAKHTDLQEIDLLFAQVCPIYFHSPSSFFVVMGGTSFFFGFHFVLSTKPLRFLPVSYCTGPSADCYRVKYFTRCDMLFCITISLNTLSAHPFSPQPPPPPKPPTTTSTTTTMHHCIRKHKPLQGYEQHICG